ncbi:hypothetical protein D3C71_1490090 [compost metagenome]
MRMGKASPSGLALAADSVGYRSKLASAGAGAAPSRALWTGSNATPPTAIDTSDCVRTFNPSALTLKSTPLAFQKRVPLVTNLSFGASTNTSTFTAPPVLSSA